MNRKTVFLGVAAAVFAAVPLLAQATRTPFLVNLFTQFAIYGLAAVSLDLVLGYGALVSFGHAAFFGLGGYAVGIVAFHLADGLPLFGAASNSAVIVWPLAVAVCALAGLAVGYLSLRTSGVQFIMITLAFGQMVYFTLVGLIVYGGNDGMPLAQRNTMPGVDMRSPGQFYYLCLLLLAAWVFACRRIVGSRFGMTLAALRQNRRRSINLGIAPLGHQLSAFVISAAGTGLAGVLWANYALFVSPDMSSWQKSGELMAMVILGGMGSIFGPILGAAVYLGLEQLLTGWTEHWMLFLGPVLVLVVLFGKRGLYGIFVKRDQHD